MPFAGGAFAQASILELGIMPLLSLMYDFMQMVTHHGPTEAEEKIQKEGASVKKINQLPVHDG